MSTLDGIKDLSSLVYHAASRRPEALAIITPDTEITFQEFENGIEIARQKLQFLRLGSGHKMALSGLNDPKMLTIFFAALIDGLMVMLLPSVIGPSARSYRLSEFKPDIIVDNPENFYQTVSETSIRSPSGYAGTVVLWTSGSSGLPKGVVLDQGALLWNAKRNSQVLKLTESDRALVLLDLAYSYALVHQVLSHIVACGGLAIAKTPLWGEIQNFAIERMNATTTALIPPMLKSFMRMPSIVEKLRKLRLLSVGGGTVTELMLKQAHDMLPDVEILITYGLTESGPRVCTRQYIPCEPAPEGLVGKPLPGVQVTVDEVGQLLVKSPSNCLGYLVGNEIQSSPLWVRTGDIGSVDSSGNVRIIGRIKPVINCGGHKISPGEIELTLVAHPKISKAKVTPIYHPRLGEVPKAYVELLPGEKLTVLSLCQYCLEQLGPTCVPAIVEFTDELSSSFVSWKDDKL